MANEPFYKHSLEIGNGDILDRFIAATESQKPKQQARPPVQARRPRNTGYKKLVRPGVWDLKVFMGTNPLGKKSYKGERFHGSEPEANRRLAEMQLEYGSNSPRKRTEMTFGMLLMLWQSAHQKIWTEATVANHASCARRLSPLDDIKLDQASPRTFAKFYDGLLDEGLAASYVTRLHSAARSAVVWAVQQGLVTSNPVASVRAPGAGNSDVTIPEPADVSVLIDLAAKKQPWFAALVQFAIVTGARRGEIAALRWEDIEQRSDGDFTVTFSRRISRTKVTSGLKASDSKRLVVDRATIERLEQFRDDSGWVFSGRGGPISVGTISRNYRTFADEVSTDMGTFHGLRHFCASHLFVQTDMNVIEIANHLGHSRPSTTMDLYAHVVEPEQTGAAHALAALISA